MKYFSIIVVAIMVIFAIIGIIDTVFLKDKLGYGAEFKKGMEMIGPLCLAIVGIIALVPEIKWVLEKTLTPLYTKLGLDPSMAVTAILAIDMGGFQLAKSVAADELIGNWAGIVYGSMMGATIVFSIPVGLAAITKKDVPAFSKGILYGIARNTFWYICWWNSYGNSLFNSNSKSNYSSNFFYHNYCMLKSFPKRYS